MTTPEEAVREARDNIKDRAPRWAVRIHGLEPRPEQTFDEALDALLTAERARLAARVSEMPGTTRKMMGDYLARIAVLALLREGA